MKKYKKIVSLLAAAAMVLLIPNAAALKASAATPTTFYLKYDTDQGQWRMQVGEWIDEYEGRETYYLNEGSEKAKDGDIVVVLANEEQEAGSGSVTVNAHLSNLTVNRSSVVISTNGIDSCYVFGDSYAAITGNVSNAYVYDNAKCTFNSDVTNLRLIASQENDVDTDVSVAGTVAYASVSNPGGVIREFYNFAKGTFYYDNASGLMTDPSNYSKSGTAPSNTAPAQPAATAAQPAASGEYDDVPKTGEQNLSIWLLGAACILLAGCIGFRWSLGKRADQ